MTTQTISNNQTISSSSNYLLLEILDKYINDAVIKFVGKNLNITVGKKDLEIKNHQNYVVLEVLNDRFFERVLAYGNLGIGESYMDQDFIVQEGTLEDFITILLRNRLDKKIKKDTLLALKIVAIQALNFFKGSYKNVQSHYDIGDDLFESFLDPTLTYSCGYAYHPSDSLEQLQINKLERICQKLKLKSGDRLLDIGCGFGGLLIYAAKNYNITGVGITISRRHCEKGNEKIAQEGLSEKISIKFQDHRNLEGNFDKVVSVGMMEHLPRSEYKRYINSIANVLNPQGMGLIHAIGCNTISNKHDPFIQKYIFPGSGQPKLSEISRNLENNRLAILDVENIVRHYSYTVRRWLENFNKNKHLLNQTKYDQRFQRMWEYYFCCGIAATLASESAVYQVLFTKDHTADIPLQRI